MSSQLMPNTIEYFELEALPGKPMFHCDKLHGTMQVTNCGDRWKIANKSQDGKFNACSNCRIGARHAGVGEISQSPLRGAMVCARCHRSATRLIRKHLCPSCMNRQYEHEKGRNARGTAPLSHPDIARLEIRILDGEKVKLVRAEVTSSLELIVTALRDTSLPVTFGFHSKQLGIPQRDLFDGS